MVDLTSFSDIPPRRNPVLLISIIIIALYFVVEGVLVSNNFPLLIGMFLLLVTVGLYWGNEFSLRIIYSIVFLISISMSLQFLALLYVILVGNQSVSIDLLLYAILVVIFGYMLLDLRREYVSSKY